MTSWWRSLSERERIVVAAGAVFVALLAAVMLIFRPVAGWRAAAFERAAAAERDYRLVHRSAALASPGTAADANGETPVRNVVNDAARQHSITLTFVNALTDGSVEIQAGPVEPDAVFQLFTTLESRYAVRATSADIARAIGEPGSVRVHATFARPAS